MMQANRLHELSEDYACSRYNESYPYLVSIDPRFGDTLPKFQFLSCSGAVTKDVLEIQIPAMNSNQNAIMLSIGTKFPISKLVNLHVPGIHAYLFDFFRRQ